MPKPLTKLRPEQINKIKEAIEKGLFPYYIVNKIETKGRVDGKGTYNVVDYVFQ